MEINELLKIQVKQTQDNQIEWLKIVKKALLDNKGDPDKAITQIKKELDNLTEKLVMRSIKLGMKWLKGNNA